MKKRTVEQWKDIDGYESIYKISNLGRVMSVGRIDKRGHKRRTKFLKPAINGRDYEFVMFQDGKVNVVHRLVGEAFVENSDDKPYINHINGNKIDNRAENLEWVTHQENVIHAIENGLRNTPKGEDNHNALLTNKEANLIRKEYNRGKTTYKNLARKYDVSISAISRLINNETYKTKTGGILNEPVRIKFQVPSTT